MEAPAVTAAERLAEKIASSSNAKAVFGEPVSKGSTTVIPVAKLKYGFGAGSGKGKDDEEGGGGGGGVVMQPIGFIEVSDGESRFRPITTMQSILPIIAVGGLAAAALLRTAGSIWSRRSEEEIE